jgi:hypothetical protein
MTQQGHFSFFSAGSDNDLRADRLGIWLIGLAARRIVFGVKVGVPRVTKGVLFWRSTPTANQVVKRLRRHLGVLGVLF